MCGIVNSALALAYWLVGLGATQAAHVALGISNIVLSYQSNFTDNVCEDGSKDMIPWSFAVTLRVQGFIMLGNVLLTFLNLAIDHKHIMSYSYKALKDHRDEEAAQSTPTPRAQFATFVALCAVGEFAWYIVMACQFFLTVYPNCSGQFYSYPLTVFSILTATVLYNLGFTFFVSL